MTREKWRERNKSVSPRFQKIPALIRKQFLYDDNGNGGGMYLWENREAAEACYSGPWKDAVAVTYRKRRNFDFIGINHQSSPFL
jgi:hypothetical protein